MVRVGGVLSAGSPVWFFLGAPLLPGIPASFSTDGRAGVLTFYALQLIGVVCAAWHAPLFLPSNVLQVFLYIMVVMRLSVIMAWIGNGSGSTLAASVAGLVTRARLGTAPVEVR